MGSGTRARTSGGGRRRTMQAGVWVLAAAAALGGVLASGQPTGTEAVDAFWRGAFAAVVTLAASRSRRWPCIWLAGLTTAVTTGWLLVFSLAALGAATVGIFTRLRSRLLGAAIGALAVQALLRIPDIGFHGFSTLVVGAAVIPLFWSAYDCAHRSTRKIVRRGIAIAAAAVVVAGLGLGLAALVAYPDLHQAVEDTRNGRRLLREPDLNGAADRFDHASRAFDEAHEATHAPWTFPARIVPVLAQHADMLATASEAGGDLTQSASEVATTAPYQDLRASKGQIDLATVRSMQEPMARSLETLMAVQKRLDEVDSPWLAAPVSDQLDEVIGDIDDTLPEARLAATGLELTPALLGGNAPRNYLVLFTSPAETRFLGGFVGAYGVLTARGGKVTFDESGSISQLAAKSSPFTRTLPDFEGRTEYEERYSRYRPEVFLQNLSVSPDFPTDAFVSRDLFRQTTGQTVDGVIVVDPYALAGFLQLTGPVTTEESGQRITSDNVIDYLLVDQYERFAEHTTEERRERLSEVADATFDALVERDLPGPGQIGRVLGPVVEQNRLLVQVFAPYEQRLFDEMGADGRFEPDVSGDYLSVRTANNNPNKIDPYLSRSIDYDVRYDPSTAAIEATARITLTNSGPTAGLPDYVIGNRQGKPSGSNTLYLSLYSPLLLEGATIGVAPIGASAQTELGAHAYSTLVTVPAGGTVTVTFELFGELPDRIDYQLHLLNQPTVTPDEVTVSVRSGSDDWSVAGSEDLEIDGDTAAVSGPVSTDQRWIVDFDGG